MEKKYELPKLDKILFTGHRYIVGFFHGPSSFPYAFKAAKCFLFVR